MCILYISGVACEYTCWRPDSFDCSLSTSGCVACGPGKPLLAGETRLDVTEQMWLGQWPLTLMRHARVPGHTLLEMVRRQMAYRVR